MGLVSDREGPVKSVGSCTGGDQRSRGERDRPPCGPYIQTGSVQANRVESTVRGLRDRAGDIEGVGCCSGVQIVAVVVGGEGNNTVG